MRQLLWTSDNLYRRLWFGAGGLLVSQLGYGWNDGGCLHLAKALCQVLGPSAEVRMVHCRLHRWCHAVACYDGLCLDGDGIATPRHLLTRWERVERHPDARLSPFDAVLVTAETPDDLVIIAALIKVLTMPVEE